MAASAPSRTIVVTGAASGIGAAVSRLLVDRGDRVIGVDLAGSDVDADLSTANGRRAATEQVTRLASGVVDGVVTSAGTSIPGEAMVTVNYFGSVDFVRGLQPALAKSAAPRVALVGSISGTHPADSAVVAACLAGDEAGALEAARTAIGEGRSHELYPSSKSAIAQWARTTAVSPGWADQGIAVNVIAPGVVLTPMTAGLVEDPEMKKVMDAAVPMPLNSYSAPEVIADALAFFLSTANTHITGQVLYVDGGAEATLRPASHF